MSLAVLTPVSRESAIELGNRIWLKKVLPVGSINYKGRVLNFTKEYLDELARAFSTRAYDQVPFQLADAGNNHTNDPDRYRGEVVGVEVQPDGLYIKAHVTPKGEEVLTENPRLGVSARIVEGYERADGRFFPQALQHVLGTLDPRIPDLGAWRAVEASGSAETTVDLTSVQFASERDALMDLTDGQRAKLAALLEVPDDQFSSFIEGLTMTDEDVSKLLAPGQTPPPAADGGLSDAELDELVEAAVQMEALGLLDDDSAEAQMQQQGEPVGAGLSNQAQWQIDLANARAAENERTIGILQEKADSEAYSAERARMLRNGVPPYIVDMAEPLLKGQGHTVDLANGNMVDAGQIVRRVLTEFAKAASMLELDVELGSPMDEPEQHGQNDQARNDLVSGFRRMTGI